jgi:hypothetical protein
VTAKAAPPGWEPHQITHRIDGWIGNPSCMPTGIAAVIARSKPSRGGDAVADIKARMIARQLIVGRMRSLRNGQ